MGVFTPQEPANATNRGRAFTKLVVKYLPAKSCVQVLVTPFLGTSDTL